MNPEAALATFHLEPGLPIAQANPGQGSRVTLDSPAIEVMTDLALVKAATTLPSTTLRQAEQIMIFKGVRMLFVVTDMPSIEGLITAADLGGDRQMQVVHDRQVRYDQLCVGDVMTELSMIEAIDLGSLRAATVGNVIATLKRHGRDHLLVVEGATAQTPRRVRGVISRAQVERQLGSPIDVTPIASSFSEIGRALA